MTTTINNEHKKLNVPNLRFPEFQGEWEKCKLGDYGKVVTGNTPPTKDIENYENGTYLWASPADLGIIKSITETKTMLSAQGFSKTRTLPKGSVLVTCIGSTIGKAGMATKEMSTNQQINSIVVNDDNDNEFVYYAIQSAFPRYLSSIAVQAVPIISKSAFELLPNNRPYLQEQKKIGKFLSLLDERIAAQNKIIDKLQSLIQGIMVELQKQGVNKGTWKKVFLSDVLTERNERNTNLFQVFSVSVSQGVVNQVDYLGRSFAAKDTSKYNVVYYGDLVYTKSPTGSFPYGIVKQSINLENVAVSPLYGVYKPKSLAVGAYLHEYFMSEINTHNYLHPLIQKGAKNTINITNQRFLESRVPMPVNSNELLLISKLLYSLNAKIKHVQNTLQEYHKQKQYLLRQMFI